MLGGAFWGVPKQHAFRFQGSPPGVPLPGRDVWGFPLRGFRWFRGGTLPLQPVPCPGPCPCPFPSGRGSGGGASWCGGAGDGAGHGAAGGGFRRGPRGGRCAQTPSAAAAAELCHGQGRCPAAARRGAAGGRAPPGCAPRPGPGAAGAAPAAHDATVASPGCHPAGSAAGVGAAAAGAVPAGGAARGGGSRGANGAAGCGLCPRGGHPLHPGHGAAPLERHPGLPRWRWGVQRDIRGTDTHLQAHFCPDHVELHRACEDASRGGHIPGGPALAWARGYAAALSSEQSCINEWLAMADLESVRPSSPPPQRPSAPELSEQVVRALLRDVMASADLESVTSKEVREELERRTGHSLAQHKDFIDNEMLLVLAQMDRPSRVFPHLYLGSEWNAANLEELQQNRVTHILNVAREIDNFFPALFTYMNVRVYDEETAQLLPHWNDTFLFLSRVRASGGRALVHCRMGLSRSAATVLAYAMKEFGWSLERALRHVRHCRPSVLPNPGFMRQLDFYQGILHASRHSSLWEPKAAERPPQPEEIPPGDEGGLSPAPSPQPPEEPSGPGLLGASRRPRISLCAVMRSISQLESPEPPGLPGEPMAGEVFAAAEAPGVPAGDTPPGHRPSSRPRRVVRQASLDGGPAPDHAPLGGHAPPATCEPTPPPAP
ncbi:protein phosphatase Slingshot homolog 3 isoform X2 [Patagioenas fasciata]|uniref:protein phosphatase Slingshot homolog 3 isoform X2 n=1 Tax=Patagioenas fasciata TaxID=372321 RepID=UPI003A9A5E66